MLPLDTTKTINGMAASGSAITCTILGDEVNTSTLVDNYKQLYQGVLTNSASSALYTVPATTSTLIKSILLANTTGSSVLTTLYIGGSASGNQILSIPVSANGEVYISGNGSYQSYDTNGNLLTSGTISLTGDVTGSGASPVTTTLATVNASPGTTGSATQSSVITTNGKGLVTSNSNTSIQIPESQVTNLTSDLAGKQATGNYITALTGDVTASGPGSSAAIVAAVQGETVNPAEPMIGQSFEATTGTYDWAAVSNFWNVIDFGATANTGGDSTLGFYNAIISCGIIANPNNQFVLTSQGTTTSTTFNLTITANAGAAASGNILMQTTSGLVYASYAGYAGTTTLACTFIAGVPSGLVLSGSIVGTPSTSSIGGTVRIPAGLYNVTHEITNSIPGVKFMGDGGGFLYGAGNWTMVGGSIIYYNGAVNGAVIRNVPLTGTLGPYAGQQLNGIRISGISIQGNQLAGHGISMISCGGFTLENIYIEECLLDQYEFTTLAASMLGGSQTSDNHRGTVTNCFYDSTIGGTGTGAQIVAANVNQTALTSNINTFTGSTNLTIVASPGTINAAWAATNGYMRFQALDTIAGTVRWYLASYTAASGTTISGVTTLGLYPNQESVTTANAATPPTGASALPSATLFSGSLIQPATGPFANGARLHGAGLQDTCCITFTNFNGNYYVGTGVDIGATDSNVFIDCLQVQVIQAGLTSYGYEFQGAKSTNFCARNNHLYEGSPGIGGTNVRGTNSYGYTLPAGPNYWDGYQLANGEARPTIGTGCNFSVTYNGAMRPADDNRGQSATGNAATVGGAGTATTGIVPSMFCIIPTVGLVVGTSGVFRAILTKTGAGTSVQFGLKYGTTNSASDGTISTGVAWTGTAVAETIAIDVYWCCTAVGSGTSASVTATMIPSGRSLGPAAVTGWITTALAYGAQLWTPAGFNSTTQNPGPAFIGLYVLANTGTIITVQPGSTSEILIA